MGFARKIHFMRKFINLAYNHKEDCILLLKGVEMKYYRKNYSMLSLFENMTKNEWIQELQNPDGNFYFLLKDEVKQLYCNTGNFIPNHVSFDELYFLSVKDTIRQFSKNLIRKKDWLFGVCEDNNLIFKKIKQRLVNNARNLWDSKRRTHILSLKTGLEYIHDERKTIYSDINTDLDDILAIIHTEPIIFKEHLKTIFNENELDYEEFDYLLRLSKYTAIDILGFDPRERMYNIRIDNKKQSYFDFDDRNI